MDEEPPRGMALGGEAPRVPACVQQKPGPPEQQPGPGRASLSMPGDGHRAPESALDLEDKEGAGGVGDWPPVHTCSHPTRPGHLGGNHVANRPGLQVSCFRSLHPRCDLERLFGFGFPTVWTSSPRPTVSQVLLGVPGQWGLALKVADPGQGTDTVPSVGLSLLALWP